MKKKIVSYVQILVCTIIIAVIITVIVGNFGTNASTKEIINHCVKISLMILTTMVAIAAIGEVKYLQTTEKEDVGICIMLALLSIIIAGASTTSYLGKISNYALYAAPILVFLAGLAHARYSIVVVVTIAGMSLILSIDEKYFLIIGVLLLVTIASRIIKFIFFTDWSKLVKEKEPKHAVE